MAEMDDLKQMWAAYDRKLDTNIRLSRQLLLATNLNRVRTPLRRMAFFVGIEAMIQLAVVVALGSFLFDHLAAPRYALPAAVLDIFAVALLAIMIRQIALALDIDYDKPIAAIQKQLTELRVLRIRYIQGIFLVSTLIWTPLLIVALKGFWGLDAYRLFGAPYLASNLLLGLAVIPLGFWLAKKFGDRMGRSPIVQRIMRDLAGYNLNAATGFLASLSEFERES